MPMQMDFADHKERSGGTELGIVPVPPLEEIAADTEFVPEGISAGEFESVWQQAKAKSTTCVIRKDREAK